MAWSGLLLVSGACLGVVALAMGVTAVVAHRLGRVAVVDVTWGLLFVAMAWVGALLGSGDGWRRVLLAVLVTVWGGRLAWHVARRPHRRGEDPRYDEILAAAPAQHRLRAAVRRVFVTQGLSAWFVALPLQVAAVTTVGPGWPVAVVAIGVLAWAVGLAFEAVGDAQLAAFKADPANAGRIMDRGLWAWTRHPNYVGDALLWWGLWALSAAGWPGVLTILSPVAMTYFLVYATGARTLERLMGQRPGYPEYAARTSMFLPRPPRPG